MSPALKLLLCLVLPPVAIFAMRSGKPVGNRWAEALANCLLCALYWIPGVIHAFIVWGSESKERNQTELAKKIAAEMKK